ncbi:MAG: bifunctional phosphopantothenoylcysteine decarboxylase/phosphopantothenate--cysteine ligase CoaBC [Gammaproteobacteria bacterium]|nr:bifunctional phosphopantothenoylcysteine decarboxylase/phosphopantothenate--cysteine ligase CoaBC [Gammaproteobacteria bacterium]MCF6230233.1 bifunctional phosphopantothenoylcysteine decarboxylase/phosphopantothenate--cysteine ligase CoaBC [Gammaproteobacteria bacterium]
MSLLDKKHIIVAVTGSIAAYKSADLVRQLGSLGAEVRVVMTRGACEFITPMTFQALTGNPVHLDLLDSAAEASMGHIELARWADLILIAPASANTLARLAAGMADDLLTTLCLATSAPLALAPAMNRLMWENKATQHNVARLQQRGYSCLGPASGQQACGEVGAGRMLEPAELVDGLLQLFKGQSVMASIKLVVTAGPTYEDIDPVRYIGNRSSGKMGYAIAAAAARSGASVILVSGPVSLAVPPGVQCKKVRSAQDMQRCVLSHLAGVDIFIAAAAVADFRPTTFSEQKIKKGESEQVLTLTANPDILRCVADQEGAPFTVGFAAETQRVEQYARSKLADKKLDMICANRVGSAEGGFESDKNALDIYWQGGGTALPMSDKTLLAEQLLAEVMLRYQHKITL